MSAPAVASAILEASAKLAPIQIQIGPSWRQTIRQVQRGGSVSAAQIVFSLPAPPASSARSICGVDLEGGFSTPTRILPSATSGSYSFGRRAGSPAEISNVITVATIPPSIVSSNITIRFVHHETI